MLAAKLLRKKFLLKVVGDYAWEQYQVGGAPFIAPELFQKFKKRKFSLITEIRIFVERFVARQADEVIVPSGYLKNIVSMWGVPLFKKNIIEERIMVISNSFEPPKIVFTKEEVQKELGLDGKIIFSAGRLVPWKGFVTLIEIMKDEAQAKLLIAGDGPDRKKLETMIDDLKLQDRVVLLGNLARAEVLKYLRASDLFVLNTGYEGFSHQILEALAMGCPIITTRVGGNTDIIADEKNGLLVNYNDKLALKTGIARLFNDDVLRERLADNGLHGDYAADRFTKERMINWLEGVLKLLPLS
ncbi:MAG: glycosyltransferase family 4 protein [Candidatus Niyogibacteria bacterium]|nr:glycosyltransferase family 4 protein [Candidatus Niyogibacteria bacterium]